MGKKRKMGKQKMKVKMNGQEVADLQEMVINDWTKAKSETAAASGSAEGGQFDWGLPEKDCGETHFQGSQENLPADKKKKGPRNYFKSFSPKKAGIILSAVLAVAIGLAFGLFVLKLVVNPQNEGQLTDASTTTPAEGKAQTASITAEAPEIKASVIQAGVFSTEEAAKDTAGKLAEKGIPGTTISMDGQNFLFIGITAELAAAQTLGGQLEAAGIDVYPKEFVIPEKEMTVNSEQEAALLAESARIFQMLLGQAANAELQGAANQDELKQIGEKIGSIDDQTVQNAGLADFKKQLTDAHKGLADFATSGSRESLARAQQALLQSLKSYHELK